MRHPTALVPVILALLSPALAVACGGEPAPAPNADTTSPPGDLQDAPDAGPDASPDTAAPAPLSGPGGPCATEADCAGPSPTCLPFPGGYCAPDCTSEDCPAGAECFEFSGGEMLCLDTCMRSSDCRTSDGHVCDADDTCWYDGPATGEGSPIGGPCTSDDDCLDPAAVCYEEGFDGNSNGFVGGYCLIFDCRPSDCPSGSTCVTVTDEGDTACFASCAGGVACPQAEGYLCADDDDACWPGCGSGADCPTGYGCDPDWNICIFGLDETPFVCEDRRFEPNETRAGGAALDVPASLTGLDLCDGDEDWYRIEAPANTLTTVGIAFPHVNGDLDLIAYDASGALLGSRTGPESYGAANRWNETGAEHHAFLNTAGPLDASVRVRGHGSATNRYDLTTTSTTWQDGASCTDLYAADLCRGFDGTARGVLHHFPHPSPTDTFVPSGYRFEGYSSYRFARRELIMLVRHAIHEVQQKYPGTGPLSLMDMSDMDGLTPGFDVGEPRHPETTHDQGGNIDVAYYQTDGSNNDAIVCGPSEGANHDGAFCTSTAGHIVDLPRTTYFLAQVAASPRTRVIGLDTRLAALITAEAARLRDAGDITSKQHDDLTARLAYGEGWPYHHHHIHISLRWWSQDAAVPNGLLGPAPHAEGCGRRHDTVRVKRD